MRGNLVWDICAFVPSKAGLTKEVVFHEGGLSKEVLLYQVGMYVHIALLSLVLCSPVELSKILIQVYCTLRIHVSSCI